jgi:hypothetical protein
LEDGGQPTPTPPTPPTPPEDGFEVPETYQGEEWAKNIKSTEDLWEQTHNAQQAIGKKEINKIPGEDASDEEVTEFHSKLKPAEYSIDDEDKKVFDTEERQKGLTDTADKLNLSKHQFKQFKELAKAEAAKNTPEAFEKAANEFFGGKDKADEALGKAQEHIEKHGDKEYWEALKTQPKETVFKMVKWINNIAKIYGIDPLSKANVDQTKTNGNVEAKDTFVQADYNKLVQDYMGEKDMAKKAEKEVTMKAYLKRQRGEAN